MNELAPRNHNQPTPHDLASSIMGRLGEWLKDHPVIETEETAKEAARLAKQASNCLADIDDERKVKTEPLNAQLKGINAEYKAASAPLAAVVEELKSRMSAWTREEEDRRWEEVEKRGREAREAFDRHDEAVQGVEEATEAARQGEVVDIAKANIEAQAASLEAQKAERALARAERATHVKLAPGLGGRTYSLRKGTELTVTNWNQALGALGQTERITEAILKDAKDYHKLKGVWPPGVMATKTRKI